MTKKRILIKNVDIWTAKGIQEGRNLFVENGTLLAIEPNNETQGPFKAEDAEEIFDGEGKQVVLPGGVDSQVHLRVPGQADKEIAETGLRAANCGGYVAALTMANTSPTIDSQEALDLGKKELGDWDKQFGVKVLWSSAATQGLLGKKIVDIKAMIKSGVSAITDDGLGIERDEVMDQVFGALDGTNIPFLQHAEIPHHGGVLAPGPLQEKEGVPPYFDEQEWKMVERDLGLLKNHPDVRYHVLHVSCEKSLELIRKAKEDGLRVTGEVTPHHLFFSSDDIQSGITSFKMNPPIRSPKDRDALWKALGDGSLSFVATDHAPHESKMKGKDFKLAAFGTTGLETSLRVLLWGLQAGKITRERLVEVFSSEPAKFLDLHKDGYGHIQVGKPFLAALIDPNAPDREVTRDDLVSRSHNNCFLGTKLPGKVIQTFGAH